MQFNMLLGLRALLSETCNIMLLSSCSAIIGICRGFRYSYLSISLRSASEGVKKKAAYSSFTFFSDSEAEVSFSCYRAGVKA